MKNILFLTGLFPKEIIHEIALNSKYNIQYAADALQWSLVKGLSSYYKNMKVINMPFVGSFPNLYKTTKIQEFAFGKEFGFDGFNLSYINLVGFKRIDIKRKVKKKIQIWIKQTTGERIIIIYHAFLPFLLGSLSFKRDYKDLKICLILPDLPQFTGNGNILFRFLSSFRKYKLQSSYKSVDYFVLLSKYMVEKLPIENKKWVVLEGIYDSQSENLVIDRHMLNDNEKIILYTGTLHKKYGILNLITAFRMLKDDNLRLIICGDGDSKNEVIFAQNEDKRIIYKGLINRNEVLNIQKQATILVNPRTAEGEFTKYSFPSKTMEYLASGVPTLLYRLPGIPEEYYDFCFALEDNSIDSLSQKISSILELPTDELMALGQRARQFILEKKNPIIQCKIIYDLFENQQVEYEHE